MDELNKNFEAKKAERQAAMEAERAERQAEM